MKNPITAVLCAALCLITGPGCTQGQKSGDSSIHGSWEGLWVAEKSFGPRLQGPVTLQRSGERWIVRLQGETVDAEQDKAADGSVSWSFAFFGQGRFVGRQAGPGNAIEGHWIQPPGMVQNYPFATPVRLQPAGPDAFAGTITPFPQEISLNIPLVAGGSSETGTARYSTFLRNPERNLGVFFRIESATVVGEEIRFANADGDVLAVGRSVEPGERFTLLFPRFGETFDFTRRSRQDAPGFYPRRWPESRPTLLKPVETGDGWRTAAPRETGLHEPSVFATIQPLLPQSMALET